MSAPFAETADDPRGGSSHHHAHSHEPVRKNLPNQGRRRAARFGLSPLWWSVPRRLGFAASLVAALWLVIAWAVA